MADALCGPSNALSSFSKHAATDRSLQQDRLVSRHEASQQGFRSAGGSRQGDAEFEAFQRGEAQMMGMPMPMPMSMPMGRGMDMNMPQMGTGQAPDWASDFQRLSLAGQSQMGANGQHAQQKSAAPAWHLDFARQQQAPAPAQQNSFSGVSGYGQSMGMGTGMGMGMGMSGFAGPAYTQTTQRPPTQQQQETPAFDEAAFEAAFEQAQRDAAAEAEASLAADAEHSALSAQAASMDRPGETDPLLARVRETRPAVYSAIQVWSETGLGRTEEAAAILDHMLSLEHAGALVTDAPEARWIVDSLRRIAETDVDRAVYTRAHSLIAALNQRLMSQYPLNTVLPRTDDPLWRELDAAGYTHMPAAAPLQPQQEQQQQEEQQQQQPRDPDADEMAATAGRLLERVADNTSAKFQNSQFLALMRRLRDREVEVKGDGLVDVDTTGTPTTTTTAPMTSTHPQTHQTPASATTTIPPIDPHILSHAATDFEVPDMYPDMDDDTFENAAR